jgi:DNA-binding NtrC family response regulator
VTQDGSGLTLLILDGLSEDAALGQIRSATGFACWVVSSAPFDPRFLIEAVRAGASNFFRYPDELEELAAAIQNRHRPSQGVTDRMIGRSEAIRTVREAIGRFAASDCSLLITGETGTGKELATQLIHESSRRAKGPLVTVNCAAIPENLFESELFGHERGAFTGAVASREGKLREANGGTLLLDEIGEMTPALQAKLLRVLETRTVERLGSNQRLPLDIRVIAATNQDLEELMGQKRFRPDLYYRLNVARIHMPPLAERPEDIRELAEHEAARWNASRRKPLRFSSEALSVMERHSWPGNVRELKNLVESLHLNCSKNVVELSDLPLRMRQAQGAAASLSERERLLAALRETHWNKSEAAHRLKWSRMTLYRKMSQYSITSWAPGSGKGSV